MSQHSFFVVQTGSLQLSLKHFPLSFVMCAFKGKKEKRSWHQIIEPTLRCHQNPFIGAIGNQDPVILGEPQIIEENRWLAINCLITLLSGLPFVAGVFPSVSCLRLLLLPAGTLPFPYLILVPAVHFFGIARLFPSNLKAIPT